MPYPAPAYATLDDWIAREALPCSLDAPAALDDAIDRVIAALGDGVELLGFGEALHGGEEILLLRNRLFARLVEAHGYRAIAIESSLPRSRLVNDHILGRGPASYEAVREAGFGHGFGDLAANRELVEWMRRYNDEAAPPARLRFYGFDMPGRRGGPVSPREALGPALDYLVALDPAAGEAWRERFARLLGPDADWENPLGWLDPATGPGLLALAAPVRLAIEDLLVALRTRRPELVAASDAERFGEALHHGALARESVNFFVALGGPSGYTDSLAVRDALMADNLAYIAGRERGRGKVLAFAHNSHLQRGQARMRYGPEEYVWWSAGAQIATRLGPRYAAIGTAIGVSDDNGIGRPEAGTLEARLAAAPGPLRLIPTFGGRGLPTAEVAALPSRSRGTKNPSYAAALGPPSFALFDWLALLDTVTYSRGGPPLP